MNKEIQVAAIQMEIIPNDIDANLNKAKKLLEAANSECRNDLVVYPEDCITGPIPHRLDLAQSDTSYAIRFFKDLAKENNTYIVAGSYIEKIGENYFNTSLLIAPNGEVALKYQKNNLWTPEKRYLTSGSEIQVVSTPLGNIGIIICWDLAFPETTRKLFDQNVDIICCPSYWTEDDGSSLLLQHNKKSEEVFVNALCPARSIENNALFIYANGAGKARVTLKNGTWEAEQIGQSQICSPVLGTVAHIGDSTEGFVIYKYNSQIAQDAQKAYGFKARNDIF